MTAVGFKLLKPDPCIYFYTHKDGTYNPATKKGKSVETAAAAGVIAPTTVTTNSGIDIVLAPAYVGDLWRKESSAALESSRVIFKGAPQQSPVGPPVQDPNYMFDDSEQEGEWEGGWEEGGEGGEELERDEEE